MSKLFKSFAAVFVAAALVFALCACTPETRLLDENNTLFTFDGEYEVTRDLLNYYLLAYKESLDKGDDAYWTENPKAGAAVITESVSYFQGQYALIKWANDLGLGYNEDDQAELEETIAYYIDYYGGEDKYNALLAESFATPEVYRRLIAEDIVVKKLVNKVYADDSEYVLVTDADIAAYAAEVPTFAAKHILIMNDSGEDSAANLAAAQNLLARIKGGEDFDALMNEYTEDGGIANYPDGYVFGEGEMVVEFENAVKALKVGEVSDVVESTYGYHIIMRLEVEDSEYTGLIVESRINAKLEEYMRGVEIKYADGFVSLEITDFVWPYAEEE